MRTVLLVVLVLLFYAVVSFSCFSDFGVEDASNMNQIQLENEERYWKDNPDALRSSNSDDFCFDNNGCKKGERCMFNICLRGKVFQ